MNKFKKELVTDVMTRTMVYHDRIIENLKFSADPVKVDAILQGRKISMDAALKIPLEELYQSNIITSLQWAINRLNKELKGAQMGL